MSDLKCPLSSVAEMKHIYCENENIKGKWTISWLIGNFSGNSSVKITSKKFHAGFEQTIKWFLQVHPKGDNTCPGYVAVYLKSCFDTPNVNKHIICTISLLNIANEKCCQYTFSQSFSNNAVDGCNKLIQCSYLDDQKNSLLPNNTLKLLCEIEMNQSVDSVTSCSYGPQLAKLSNDFSDLCLDSKLSDVVIVVKDKKFSAHKAILGARSPVFFAMFEHSLKESKTSVVEINDAEPKVMQEIMHYIYSGHCPQIKDMAFDILPVADKYCLTELKKMTEEVLSTEITPGNAVENLILAHRHSAPLLKANALDYISNHGMEVMNTSGWNYIKEYPDLLLDICGNTFTECLVIKKTVHIEAEKS